MVVTLKSLREIVLNQICEVLLLLLLLLLLLGENVCIVNSIYVCTYVCRYYSTLNSILYKESKVS